MAEQRQFQDKQYAFAAHIRDPANTVAPTGIEDRRMAIYRDLFFNNLYNLLGTFFPVIRKILSDHQWRRIVRDFMRIHRAKTPYFLQLPEEFLAFLQTEFTLLDDDYPFLKELAHYEYAELALRVAEDIDAPGDIDPDGDFLSGIPVKSELAWAFAYRFPVHRISVDYQPKELPEQPTYLVVYRRSDDTVGFLEQNAVTAALLETIENNLKEENGESILRDLAIRIGYADPDALIEHGVAALEEMRQLEILVGTR